MNLKETFFTAVLIKLFLGLILFALSIYGFRICSGTTEGLVCTTGLIIPVQMTTSGGEPVSKFLTDFPLIALVDIIFWYIVASIVVERVSGSD